LKDERFIGPFLHKGRLGDELIGMPVYVILNPKAALIGAARHGLEQAAGRS
jgi:glucokinase